LSVLFPEISAEWHPSKNGDIVPSEVSPRTTKIFWWLCSKDISHEWQASNSNRTRKNGGGCPYCSNKRVDPKRSLLAVYPDLAQQWHPTKNRGALPSEVPPNGKTTVWWKCSQASDHEWRAPIYSRASGVGCPFCANRKVSYTNRLSTIFPELIKEWDFDKNTHLSPDKITIGSAKYAWWICQRESTHRWRTIVRRRTQKNGSNCPFCTSQTSEPEIRLYVELLSIFPNVVNRHKIEGVEIDLFIPSLNVGIEYDGSYFHRNKLIADKKKNAFINKRGINLIRVRHAPLQRIGLLDVIVKNTEISKYDIDMVLTNISNYCDEKTAVLITKYCRKTKFADENNFRKFLSYMPSPFPENTLDNLNPEISITWNYEKNHPLKPTDFSPGSKKKVWWTCSPHGHEWQASISDRVYGNGCPGCSGRVVTAQNNFEVNQPAIAKEWHPTKNGGKLPNGFTAGSNSKVWWLCSSCQFTWRATLYARAGGTGCPACAGKVVTAKNNLGILLPELASEWHTSKNTDLTPLGVTLGNGNKYWWQCKLKETHIWSSTIANRASGKGCPFCSNKAIDNENSLRTLHPDIALGWHPTLNGTATPDNVAPGSSAKAWWFCTEGDDHIWETNIRSRIKASGCPFCSGRKLSKDNSLAVLAPQLSLQWHPNLNGIIGPADVTLGSTKRIWWICPKDKDHVWDAVVYKRAKDGRGCPYCAGRKRKRL